jgi:hypothetical protein
MSLTALNARMTVANTVPVAAVLANNTVNLILDNFYVLLTNATSVVYADGTARNCGTYANEVVGSPSPVVVRGTGSAWTWSKEIAGGVTVAIIGAPPSTATAFCQLTRIVIAGTAAATIPGAIANIAGSADTAALNGIWFGLVKNVVAGVTYNGWNNVAPWTGCVFAGYTRWGVATTNILYNTNVVVRVIETQETNWFQITSGATGQNTLGAGGGAWIDPETGDAADAETDGRLYGASTVGPQNMPIDWLLQTSANGMMLFDGGGSNVAHSYSYSPGLSSVVVCNRIFNSNVSTLNLVTRTGKYPRVTYFMGNPANWAGRLREVQIVRDGFSQQTFSTGATINGFTFGYNPNLSGDCLLLQY